LLYSIKIAGLTKKNTISEQLKIAAEANLNNAQQQLQQAQDQLATATEQQTRSQKLADTEKQRASIAEQQLIKRNQQIGAIIQSLASSFDIGQRPLPVTDDLKADDLWQQHDKVIQQLIERLRTEQLAKTELEKFYHAEKAKTVATDAQLLSLQADLDSQSSLLATLQQELNKALNNQLSEPVPLAVIESKSIVEQTTPDSNNAKSLDDSAEKLKSLFKKPAQQPPTTPIQTLTPSVVNIPTTVLVDNKQSEVAVESKPIPAPIEEQTEKTSVLKGLYQNFTTAKPEPVVESKPEPIKDVSEKTNTISGLKGLYQKFTTVKPEQADIVPEPAPPVVTDVVETVEEIIAPVEQTKPATTGRFPPSKRLEVKPLTIEPSSRIDEAADLITEKVDKLKNLYGRFFSKSE
jgi:hypothetical protein